MTTKNDGLQSDLRRSAALARYVALAIALFSASPAVAGSGAAPKEAGAQSANSQIAGGEAIARARCGVCKLPVCLQRSKMVYCPFALEIAQNLCYVSPV